MFGLKNSFRMGSSSLPDESQRRPVRGEQRLVVEGVGRLERRRVDVDGRAAAPELFEQVGAEVLRIQELLEPHGGELADLFLGVVHAALLGDAPADLLHDLLDVHRFGSDVEIGHGTPHAADRGG